MSAVLRSSSDTEGRHQKAECLRHSRLLVRVVRNLSRSGLAACAISAVDTALWDLKARAVGLPLAKLLGRCRDRVPIYGSGGFTSYSDDQLARSWLVGHTATDVVSSK